MGSEGGVMECDWVELSPDGTVGRRCPGADSQMFAGNGGLYCPKHHEELYRWFMEAKATQ